MITYYKRTVLGKSLGKLDGFEVGSWINVVNPNKEELKEIKEKYALDEELLEEGLDENELPRIDFYENKTYIFFKAIATNNTLATFLVIIGDKFIVTLSKEELPFIKPILDGKIKLVTTQKVKMLITLLYENNEQMEKEVAKIVKTVQKKKNTTKKLMESDMEQLLIYEDELNNLVSAYYYTSLLYSKMIKRIKLFDEDKEELEDLIIESNQGLNLCRTSMKTIAHIRNYYSIILSNRLNRTIKILTIFTILIAIPAAVSSIYGMNVPLPLQNHSWTFLYVVGLMIAIISFFVYYFKKKEVF